MNPKFDPNRTLMSARAIALNHGFSWPESILVQRPDTTNPDEYVEAWARIGIPDLFPSLRSSDYLPSESFRIDIVHHDNKVQTCFEYHDTAADAVASAKTMRGRFSTLYHIGKGDVLTFIGAYPLQGDLPVKKERAYSSKASFEYCVKKMGGDYAAAIDSFAESPVKERDVNGLPEGDVRAMYPQVTFADECFVEKEDKIAEEKKKNY